MSDVRLTKEEWRDYSCPADQVVTGFVFMPDDVERLIATRVAAAEQEALERAVQAILDNVPYGYGMNPDGTEDRIAMAYVEGNREAWQVVRDLMPRKDGA